MPEVHLEKVDWKNYYQITQLKVAKAQKDFVASNEWSLVHAYAALASGAPVYPFGIYLGKKPIGFVMVCYDAPFLDESDPECLKRTYCIWRFMIDKRYQGKGYGRKALERTIDFIKTFPAGKSNICWLSYEPSNEGARHLYASLGFAEAPEYYVEGEEMPAILKL